MAPPARRALSPRIVDMSKSSRLAGLRGFVDRAQDTEDSPLRSEDGRRRLVLDDLDDGPSELPDLGREARALRRVLATSRRLARAADEDELMADLLDAALLLLGGDRAALVRVDGETVAVERARDASGDATASVNGGLPLAHARTAGTAGRPSSGEEEVEGGAERSVVAAPAPAPLDGVLVVDAPPDPGIFGPLEGDLLRTLAEQGALALARVRLTRHAERQTRDLAEADARAARLNRRLADLLERRTSELRETRERLARIDATEGFADRYSEIVGRGPAMLALLRQVDRIAATTVPVLFEGESGSGKEVIAQAVQGAGDRAGEPFVTENCGALPESLLENELFGHERGAFTGAETTTAGLFERADGGTLFLDEVGEMSPKLQTRLLRVLQEGEVRRVGGDTVRKVDVRLLTATNRDLRKMVREGTFREDLFYRLAVVTIRVPSLRERREDIPALVGHFAERFSESGLPLRVTDDALDALVRYDWPGNVRQLQNELRRSAALSRGEIDVDSLSNEVRECRPEIDDVVSDPIRYLDGRDLRSLVEEVEKRVLRAVLGRENGNITHAARSLGLSRLGLRKKLRRYGLYEG